LLRFRRIVGALAGLPPPVAVAEEPGAEVVPLQRPTCSMRHKAARNSL
jgi:hypothetical protein